MKDKVLIKLIAPELDLSWDVYIPVNDVIWRIKRLLIRVISDVTGVSMDQNIECILLNKHTCRVYNNNDVVIDTDIRNGTELFIISKI